MRDIIGLISIKLKSISCGAYASYICYMSCCFSGSALPLLTRDFCSMCLKVFLSLSAFYSICDWKLFLVLLPPRMLLFSLPFTAYFWLIPFLPCSSSSVIVLSLFMSLRFFLAFLAAARTFYDCYLGTWSRWTGAVVCLFCLVIFLDLFFIIPWYNCFFNNICFL